MGIACPWANVEMLEKNGKKYLYLSVEKPSANHAKNGSRGRYY
jgi:hypothetical protein